MSRTILQRHPRARVVGLIALLTVVGIGSLISLSKIDLGAAAASLSQANPQLLAISAGLYLLGQTLSGVMWSVCKRAGGVRMALGTTLGIHWISRAACELLPASLGEGVRVALVRRHPRGAEAGTWRILGNLTGYKVLDSIATALLVVAIALATPLPGPAGSLRWMAVIVVVAMAALALAWRLGVASGLRRVLSGRLRSVAHRLGEGAGVLSNRSASRSACLFSLASLLVRIVSLGFLLAAFEITPLAAPLVFASLVISGIVPGAPGGAGTRELILLPALTLAHHVPVAQALAFSISIQITALGASLLAGAIAGSWLGPAILSGWEGEETGTADLGLDVALEPLPATAPGA